MSDEGMPVGAALSMYYQLSGDKYAQDFQAMEHVYLGSESSNEEIQQELAEQNVDAAYYDDIELVVARLLAEGGGRCRPVQRANGIRPPGPGQPDYPLSGH
jgi:predicted NodU family carbamoyl transferase